MDQPGAFERVYYGYGSPRDVSAADETGTTLVLGEGGVLVLDRHIATARGLVLATNVVL